MYHYNPKVHLKIWLSNNPNVFMNLENRIRLIEMRENNTKDIIHLIYDSTLLTRESIDSLHEFGVEHTINLVDAHTIQNHLQSENEKKLYHFYKDELNQLKSGGNLAVASDILRWLSPIFSLGTYTDFDFPVDTSALPSCIEIEAPLLLNIGSLRIGKKEFILANNDFIAIVDPIAAAKKIDRVQRGILEKLTRYDTDFVERTEHDLNAGHFINRHILKFMKNRSESLYIAKSKEINTADTPSTSLNIRSYINEIMSDKYKFLDFNKTSSDKSHKHVIKRLRNELSAQLNLIKFLFFSREYTQIKRILNQNDDKFLNYLMKKERDLYLKSIVICTTGPIEVSNALFDGYVVDIEHFTSEIQPLSFNHYGLQKAFQSQNSIPLHENVFGMLKFLGVQDGTLNDSSWLHSGRRLQSTRVKQLAERQKELALSVPDSLTAIKYEMEQYLEKISRNSSYNIFFKTRNLESFAALELILKCFHQEENEFNISEFKDVLRDIQHHKKDIYAKKLVNNLNKLCRDAVLFSLAKDKKIKL